MAYTFSAHNCKSEKLGRAQHNKISLCIHTGISKGFLPKFINCTLTPLKNKVNSSICSVLYQKRGAVSISKLHHDFFILVIMSSPVPCGLKQKRS